MPYQATVTGRAISFHVELIGSDDGAWKPLLSGLPTNMSNRKHGPTMLAVDAEGSYFDIFQLPGVQIIINSTVFNIEQWDRYSALHSKPYTL